MLLKIPHRTSLVASSLAFALAWLVGPAASSPARAQAPPAAPSAPDCDVDLTRPGVLRDILSNALMGGFGRPEAQVAAYLRGDALRHRDAPALLRNCAQRFSIPEAELGAAVERFRHCNCAHGQQPDPSSAPLQPTAFARDVTLHVVLHELGHALVREFDLPVLGNEETMADAFATHYLVRHLPDRALAVLRARLTSWSIESRAVPRAEWPVRGEHDNDARRAFQVAALAIAADAERYAELADLVGMSEADVVRARDYGAEIHRSWRRVLAPLWMPSGQRSAEGRVRGDPTESWYAQLGELGLVAELEDIVTRIDWHSQVTIRFVDGDGTAAWSRSSRTVTVHSAYVRRFVGQGRAAGW